MHSTLDATPVAPQPRPTVDADATLRAEVARFRTPSLPRAVWQLASTIAAFLAVCATMYASFGVSYGLTLGLAVVAAGLTVRLFIIQHDCGHLSFFASPRANIVLGRLCSLFTFTPFANWRRQHAGHHSVWNNLDRRDSGVDIYSTCLTVAEYRALAPRRRLLYRLSRHPVVTGLLLPPLVFLLLYRIPFDTPKDWRGTRCVCSPIPRSRAVSPRMPGWNCRRRTPGRRCGPSGWASMRR